MNLDVDFLIDFFNKHSGSEFKDEIDEQDAGATTTAPSGGGGGGGGSVPKWADSYPLKRGKSNPLMKSGEKWNTGLTRGSANQIW
jgi:hypothetical protein